MIRTLALWIGLLCSNILTGQEMKSTENQVITGINTSQTLACKLTGPEFQKRIKELQERVFSSAKSYEKLEEGYLFHFDDEGDFLITLIDYMLAEQVCCPFFDFDLKIRSNNGGISWKISGPPDAKKLIEMILSEE